MKPIPAIVEPAQVDIDLCAEQIIVALADQKQAEASAARHQQLAEAARGTAKMRRLEIGRTLARVRAAWPERGPNAKHWGEFLERVKIAPSTARMYIDEFRDPDGFAEKRRLSAKTPAPDDDEIADRDAKPANVIGGSGDPVRGSYCTPKKYADAIGPWDLDPFSNPHTHVVAKLLCMLENAGNGIADPAVPGSYRLGPGELDIGRATEFTRVFIQPDYRIVRPAIAHYGHTRFCALLRFAPDTRWFAAMWPRVKVVAVPRERLPFETPDGIELEGADEGEDRGAPFPHVFYYADERDVTPAIRELCIMLRRDEALHIVR